jgi:8-oxo-dGTP pyrophosphatase MutT (NUDIX family)
MTKGVLVYMFRGAHILLAMKKRGFGEGKWNGPGGKIEFGENALHAAIRETKEEVGVTPLIEHPLGNILYHDQKFGNWQVTVFRAEEFSGDMIETEEMRPQWWPIDDIPYEDMWAGDAEWMPYVIQNQPFDAELWFDGHNHLIRKDIKKVVA